MIFAKENHIMENIIYYFTGTGNSLAAARLIAKHLKGETELRAFTNYLNCEEVIVEPCETLGFIFPAYGERAPWPVYAVTAKMKLSNKPYIFEICTCNDRGGSCLDFFATWIKKHGLYTNYTRKITMPGNCMATNDAENAERIADCEMFAKRSADNINKRFISSIEGFDDDANNTEGRRDKMASFFKFTCDTSKCISCGLCTTVCPMNNINLPDGHPAFGDKCAICFACFHWCPTEAVRLDSAFFNSDRQRYHHPQITAEDISAQQKRF